jgi:hypothetical protein
VAGGCSRHTLADAVSGDFYFMPLSEGMGHFLQGRELDILCMVFYPRYGGLLCLEPPGEFFLCQACLLPGLLQDHTYVELLVAVVQPVIKTTS